MKYNMYETRGGHDVYQKTIKRYIALVENNNGYQQLLSIDATDCNQAARIATQTWDRKGNVLAISARVPQFKDGAALPLYEVVTEVVKKASVGGGYAG